MYMNWLQFSQNDGRVLLEGDGGSDMLLVFLLCILLKVQTVLRVRVS